MITCWLRYRQQILTLFVAVTVVFGTYCVAADKQNASGNGTSADVPQHLDDRARAYWMARVAGDLITTYEFEADSVIGTVSLAEYTRKKGRIIYKRAKVLNTAITGKKKAVVNLVAEVIVPGLPGSFTSEFKDGWVFIDGLWYHGNDRS